MAAGSGVDIQNIKDGEYSLNVSLEGGSGRATVESPCTVCISNGEAYATIVWSSPNYDYMKIDEEVYYTVNDGGNSAFEIPVTVFDEPMMVVADTTAMSVPHEIEYTLTFDSTGLGNSGLAGNVYIKCGIGVVIAVFIAAGIIVYRNRNKSSK